MKKILLFTTLLTLVVTSCEKNQQELFYEDYQSSTLLRQVGETENDMQILTYYNTGNIFEHLGRYSYRKYSYNSDQKLGKIELALSSNPLSCAIITGTSFEDGGDPRKAPISQYIEFKYNDEGKIAQKDYYYMNEQVTVLGSIEKLEYVNDKIVKSKIYNPQDQLIQYRTFLYNENGNLSSEEYFICYNNEDNGTLITRTEYEYDDKINPFKVFAVEGSPGIFTNANNIIKQKTINYYEDEELVNTVVNTYEYNNLGYPVNCNGMVYTYGVDQ